MSIIHTLISECNANHKNIIATIIEGEQIGHQMLLSDGQIVYCSNAAVFNEMLQNEVSALRESGIMNSSSGQIFCEILGGEKRIIICGGGHVSIPIISIGKMLGFHIIVLEDRPMFADNARAAGAHEVLCESFDSGLDKIIGDKDTYFVIVTRGHRYDQTCLTKIIEKEHAYIGMIGSKLRIKTVKELLKEEGISMQKLDEVYAPIGLNIKAETPEEIAVAIIGEIIQVKNQIKRSNGYEKVLLSQIALNSESVMPSVLATIISRKGSAPREVGTKMLICQDGKTVGTIGGGCVEAELFQKAIHMTKEQETSSKVFSIDMTGRDVEDEGMVCGGIIEVILERVS